jgi:hypothetical protein
MTLMVGEILRRKLKTILLMMHFEFIWLVRWGSNIEFEKG